MHARTSFIKTWVIAHLAFAAVLAALLLPTRANADAFANYHAAGSFSLPSSGPFDTLPDGRVVVLAGDSVRVETASGSHTFATVGTLPDAHISSFGAAFLRVSPNGSQIAVGNNGGTSPDFVYQVGVFPFPALSGGKWFNAIHSDAEWIDEQYIALTAGDVVTFSQPSFVTRLDTLSASTTSPANPTFINNIGGASAGIAFDAARDLFTGNGSASSGPSVTGQIKAFSQSAWSAAITNGTPINFETAPTAKSIGIVLSAAPLGFDAAGDLLVGGGDFSGVGNYAAIVRASAVATALGGGAAVNPADPTQVLRLDPEPMSSDKFYSIVANPARNEVEVVNFGSTAAYVYSANAVSNAPAMPAWAACALAMALALTGLGRRATRRLAAS
jgi:hypothetical protein